MKRSGKSFSKKGSEKSSDKLPIVQLIIMAIAIVIIAAIFVQNRQPAVQIVFFGQKTLPISLSVAMLIAFGVGGAIAFTINSIASWRHNTLIKQVLAVASAQDPSTEVTSRPSASDPKEVKTNSQSFYQTPQNNQSSQNNQNNNDLQEEDDWEEDELYEEDFEEEELEEEDYEDEDPETVPYGDLQKRKSSKSNRQKRDRPPLDARYIR